MVFPGAICRVLTFCNDKFVRTFCNDKIKRPIVGEENLGGLLCPPPRELRSSKCKARIKARRGLVEEPDRLAAEESTRERR